jgi:CHAD domain-containing protein
VKSLVKFSKYLIQDLVDRLHFFQSYQEEETLHDIRVEIKKVKAVLSLLGYSHKKFKNRKSFLPFRNVFRKAGAIREPIVLHSILNDKQQSELKSRHPSIVKGAGVEAFLDDTPFFIEGILSAWTKIKPWVRKESRKDFNAFIKKKKKEIERGLFPTPDMDTIHTTRKNIKALLYLSKIKNELTKEEETFYHEMEQTIGQWHDKQVLQANLKNQNGGADKAKIKKVGLGIKQDKTKIKEMAENFYQSN